MADFTTFFLECNINALGTQTWQNATGANHEVRFADASTAGQSTASASWPYSTRPASGTAAVPYAWVYTADTTGFGIMGGSASAAAPGAFSNANYLQARWNWDNLGTFASAPIFTAYPTNAHGAVSRGDASVLGGQTTDTGATQRSYLKGNAFGRVTSAGAPAAAPTNAPVVTDGASGSLVPTAGANWLTNYQGLQGDNDFITFPSTPAATTADTWYVMFDLFYGVNLLTGTYTNVMSCKYTFV